MKKEVEPELEPYRALQKQVPLVSILPIGLNEPVSLTNCNENRAFAEDSK